MIQRTTSRMCRNPIAKHILRDDTFIESMNELRNEREQANPGVVADKEEPTYIYTDFASRTFIHKIERIIYLVFRTFYVSIWFYFLPFLAMIGSYFVPYFMIQAAK
jgi:hypothetical protein